ncbi:hypothetical protein DVH24_019018 [Malus domestica]|uniref:Uncharacterized protein n=1 Tax=Malus domestica TaxID=3750 RepID=A0A498HZ72_MALDO|nr:hypothetical protein DVH24_019018 [Malus domestica]
MNMYYLNCLLLVLTALLYLSVAATSYGVGGGEEHNYPPKNRSLRGWGTNFKLVIAVVNSSSVYGGPMNHEIIVFENLWKTISIKELESFVRIQQQQQQSLFPLSGVGYMNPRTPLRSVLCHVLR